MRKVIIIRAGNQLRTIFRLEPFGFRDENVNFTDGRAWLLAEHDVEFIIISSMIKLKLELFI